MSYKPNDYLVFTRRERSGVLLLLFLSAVGWMLPFAYERLYRPHVLEWKEVPVAAPLPDSLENSAAALFEFDPNLASPATLRRLGLPSRTVSTILRYREKGGRFPRPESLRKIYNLSEADYRRIAPYIRIAAPPRPARPAAAGPTGAPSPTLFSFDPNTTPFDSLRRLGLPARLARTLINYREAGGVFRHPGDLEKVYGMTTAHLERLLPYMVLVQRDSHRVDRPQRLRRAPDTIAVPVDINRADAATWARLRGIGPVLSQRIVRFRERLGGFTHVDQVAETYGLPDSTFQAIRPHLQPSPLLRQLTVNELEWEALSAHPYLDRRQARALVAYRDMHGPFSGPEDMKKVRALPPAILTRLLPYCTFGKAGAVTPPDK